MSNFSRVLTYVTLGILHVCFKDFRVNDYTRGELCQGYFAILNQVRPKGQHDQAGKFRSYSIGANRVGLVGLVGFYVFYLESTVFGWLS